MIEIHHKIKFSDHTIIVTLVHNIIELFIQFMLIVELKTSTHSNSN